MNPLDKDHSAAIYRWGLVIYFFLFSFNALATATMASLIGTKWVGLDGQQKFLIVVAVGANWTGLVVVFVQKSLARMGAGRPPIETGDTEHRHRES